MIMWLAIFILFVLVELVTTNLVTIWFAIGAIFAGITAVITPNIYIQICVFIVISLIALILTHPFLKQMHLKSISRTNADMVIGKEGIVTQKITKLNSGMVKINGILWTAILEEKSKTSEIPENTIIFVLGINGVKLIVREVN